MEISGNLGTVSPDPVSGDLAEEFMDEVEEIVRELDDGSVPYEDLIQEGYVGLLEGISLIDGMGSGEDCAEEMSVADTIRTAIKGAVKHALESGADSAHTDLRLVAQVELLNKSIDRLTEELGTRPNIDEIANDMQVSQDTVLSILKLTGGVSDDGIFTSGEKSQRDE